MSIAVVGHEGLSLLFCSGGRRSLGSSGGALAGALAVTVEGLGGKSFVLGFGKEWG